MIGADIVGSQNVEFLWLQNSARRAARKLVTLLLLALRKLPRKRSQKRSRKSYALLANPVPCSCPKVLAARLDEKLARSLLREVFSYEARKYRCTGGVLGAREQAVGAPNKNQAVKGCQRFFIGGRPCD